MSHKQQITDVASGLWHIWEGEGHIQHDPDSLTFYTVGTVTLHEDIYRESLARAMQREGVVDGLGAAFKALTDAKVDHGVFGYLEDGERIPIECESNGETYYGDVVDYVMPVTWVEVLLDA